MNGNPIQSNYTNAIALGIYFFISVLISNDSSLFQNDKDDEKKT